MGNEETTRPEDYFVDYFFDFTIEVCGDRVTIWDKEDIIEAIDRSDRDRGIEILIGLYDYAIKHKRRLRSDRKIIKQSKK